jgi:hypothetical protein
LLLPVCQERLGTEAPTLNGRYRIIDEVSFNVLGTFTSLEAVLDFVATLLTANADDFLDELSISHDEGMPFTGDVLRAALSRRSASREHVAAPSRGGS